jgi:hypothetical protein
MAEKKVIELDLKTNTEFTVTALKKAQREVAILSEKFGATSKEAIEAAKQATILKDKIGDAKSLTDAFNPDAKFKALSGSLTGVAGGFSVVTGAMGTFGVESEAVEKTLLKVQSAMALASGAQALGESIDSFRQLGAVAKTALSGIRTGIAATGIGLFVVALGTVVAYWDDIKTAVSGVSEEQEALNEQTHQNTEFEKEKLETLGSQDNILKLQGKTEKEILQIKIAQNERVIKTTEAEIKQKEITAKLEIKAAERNASIMKTALKASLEFSAFGLRLLAAPIDLVLTTANKISEALGFGKITAVNLNDEISNLINYGAEKLTSFIFDPAATKAAAEADIQETKDGLIKMKNEVAGFKLQIIELDKPSKTAKKETEKAFESYEKLEYKKAQLLKHSEITLQGHVNENVRIQKEAAEHELLILQAKAIKAQQLDEKAQSEKVKLTKAGFDTIAQISELFGKRSEAQARKAFKVQKAASMASALITTYQSARSAYASQFVPLPDPSSPVRGAIAAGIAIASGLANVAKIGQQKFEGGSPSGGGGNIPSGNLGGGGTVMSPNFNIVGNSGMNQLAQLQQQPTKAYVVSGDMTTAQALDRNRIENATLVQ